MITIPLTFKLNVDSMNINIRDYDNRTPLLHACMYGHVGIVKQLLNCNADVDMASSLGYTPLHAAALIGNKEIATLLLDRGCTTINSVDSQGFTPLAFAVREGHEELIELFLSRNASMR